MKRLVALSALFVFASPAFSQGVPEGVTLSQWVREDLFAGFLAGSMNDFNRGVEKVDAILAAEPENAEAIVWKGSAELYLAVRELEAGRRGEYQKLLARGLANLERAYELAPKRVAVLAVTGGVAVVLGDRVAQDDQTRLLELGRQCYTELEKLQSGFFQKMPIHHQGEVLAGLAHLDHRLGNQAQALENARRVVATLAGSPYERPAQRYLADPDGEPRPSLACQSCHDENRLENVLARAKPVQ